jgi:hypothetical protein
MLKASRMHCAKVFPLCVGVNFSSDQVCKKVSGLKFFNAILFGTGRFRNRWCDARNEFAVASFSSAI